MSPIQAHAIYAGRSVPENLDHELYKKRFSVELINAWIDTSKALLIRFQTKSQTWVSLHYLAFSLILIKNQTNHFYTTSLKITIF